MTHGDAAVLKVQHWLRDTHAQDIALSSLAARAELEERTFLRRFQKATGMTSTQYCQRIRIGRGRALLESGAMSIDAVAWEVGYQDAAAFRKVFKRIRAVARRVPSPLRWCSRSHPVCASLILQSTERLHV